MPGSDFQRKYWLKYLSCGVTVQPQTRTFLAACAAMLSLAGCAEEDGQEQEHGQEAACAESSVCPVPQAPALSVVHPGELRWHADCFSDQQVQVGLSADLQAEAPDEWMDTNSLQLSDQDLPYSIQLFARVNADGCEAEHIFTHACEVRANYAPGVDEPDTTAIAMDDPVFVDWASDWVEPVLYGEEVEDKWRTPDKALGPAQGSSTETVSLGRGGQIALVFEPPIRDGQGRDFAVFENAMDDTFLEIAYVEVSTDGERYVRFDHAYLGDTPLDAFDRHEPVLMGGFAGKYPQGWGTPFDLRTLANKPEVLQRLVDLQRIAYVKIVDVVGDGSETDSFGNPIYDPFPTTSSAGFDLDAVGVINN